MGNGREFRRSGAKLKTHGRREEKSSPPLGGKKDASSIKKGGEENGSEGLAIGKKRGRRIPALSLPLRISLVTGKADQKRDTPSQPGNFSCIPV